MEPIDKKTQTRDIPRPVYSYDKDKEARKALRELEFEIPQLENRIEGFLKLKKEKVVSITQRADEMTHSQVNEAERELMTISKEIHQLKNQLEVAKDDHRRLSSYLNS